MSFNYFDFANETYNYLTRVYDMGIKSNSMASQIQNTCERYLKHIVEEYDSPENNDELLLHNDILRTHSVNNLVRYLDNNMNITFSDNVKFGLFAMDNLYFVTRYPGRDSRMINELEIDEYMNYLTIFKQEYDSVLTRLEQLENSNEYHLNNEDEIS